MNRGVAAAVRPLSESDRKDLTIQALAGSATVSDLAARHGMSRKFVYQQMHKARAALDDAFSPATPDEAVLFELAVTKIWLRQVITGLTLICRSSYRGVVEFLRDLLGLPVSLGHVHDVLQAATRQASAVNAEQDLSGIRVGLHDEIFQGATPVLAGVDARSTYCYLLVAEQHRDADTWGVHLLDAAEQGLRPDYTIADAGRGLRAGQQAAWGDTPCHGDVFHIQRQCGASPILLCGRPLVGQWGRAASGPPDGREQPSAWHTKTQLLVRRRAASARVDLSGRSSPRHHPKATARRAGQRRCATSRCSRSHAQARPLLRAGRAWRAPTRCPVRAPWHMSCQQPASTVSARCGFIACSTRC